jgi:hypothetical protein
MFRKLTFAALIMISLAFVQAERYYVTFIKGTVILKKTGKPLKIGDALLSTDALVFKESSGKVSCISPGKGRFDISAAKISGGSKNELLAVLKSNLVPSTGTYRLSTRSLMFEGYDPKSYFVSPETHDRILLLRDEVLPIVPSYKIDNASFFFIQYISDGKTVTKKLAHTDKGVIFSDADFLGISSSIKFCYQEQTTSGPKSAMLAEFVPVLADKEEIRQEAKLIATHSGIADKKKLKEYITGHVFDNYGKIGTQELDKLLE